MMIPIEAYYVTIWVFVSRICFEELMKYYLADQAKLLAMSKLNVRVFILILFLNLFRNLHQHVDIESKLGLICKFPKAVLDTFHLKNNYFVKQQEFSERAVLFIQSAGQELDMFTDGVS